MATGGDNMTFAPYLALEVHVYDGMLNNVDFSLMVHTFGLTGSLHATLLHRVI